jgi:hypothetical protein
MKMRKTADFVTQTPPFFYDKAMYEFYIIDNTFIQSRDFSGMAIAAASLTLGDYVTPRRHYQGLFTGV